MQKKDEKLIELLGDFDNATFVTHSPRDGIHARPMRVAKLTEDGELFFVTSRKSGKVKELALNSDVTLVFQGRSKFVSLIGTAVVENNRELIESLWTEAWAVWFPKGKTDPAIRIVRIVPREAEYWNNEGLAGLSYAFAAAKAYVKGETPQVDEDQHGKLVL